MHIISFSPCFPLLTSHEITVHTRAGADSSRVISTPITYPLHCLLSLWESLLCAASVVSFWCHIDATHSMSHFTAHSLYFEVHCTVIVSACVHVRACLIRALFLSTRRIVYSPSLPAFISLIHSIYLSFFPFVSHLSLPHQLATNVRRLRIMSTSLQGELSFEEGDMIYISSKNDDGWW